MSARPTRRHAALALAAAVGISLAACSSSGGTGSAQNESGKTAITVDCPPLKTANNGQDLAAWLNDVADFEKQNPDIVIKSVSVGAQCDNPPDFTARLQAGTEADVFYGYMTDLQQVLDSGQAADITSYVNTTNVPNWDSITDNIKKPFEADGKIYGIGYAGYTMGLVYNKNLFTQAGLDPSNPPTTWADVAADAKKIAALGNGIAGYEDYSAGNTGGWHFTAELYAAGGADVSADGKTATVNTPQAQQVLQNLHDMRFVDNSVGTKQLLTWPDLLTNAGAGKVGMYLGAPDTVTAIVSQFKGNYQDWLMGPMPGYGGPAKGTLGGGSGYFFNKHDTPAQIVAGLKWLDYEELTPGQGQFNYKLQASEKLAVGLPEPLLWTPGSALDQQDQALKKQYNTLDPAAFAAFVNNPVPVVVEPPDAQQIYAVLDGVMSSVLTDPNANITDLLNTANGKVQTILNSSS